MTAHALTVQSHVDQWLSFADVRQTSRETYRKALKQFREYLAKHGITLPSRQDIVNWKDEMLHIEKRKPSTVQTYLIAIKLYFRWLNQKGYYTDIAGDVKGVSVKKGHKRDALTESQAVHLLSSIDKSSKTGLRDYAMIALMVTTGLRTIEIIRADKNDLKMIAGQRVLFIQGKGDDDKSDYVKLSPKVYQALMAYLDTRADDNAALFVSSSHRNQGMRLTTKTIRNLVAGYLTDAGYKTDRLSAHSLRHTAATLALLNGISIRQVQQLLRHQNIQTALIYLHDLDRQANNAELIVSNRVLGCDYE